jgi:hypothetical protein
MLKRALALMFLCAGLLPAKSLLYLPVSGDLDKDADVSTVNELFKDAVQAAYDGDVKFAAADTVAPCTDKECAAKLAASLAVDEVVYATVKRLGSKWIFSATRYTAATKLAFNQRGTSVTLEDLEAVTKRVSDALLAGKTTAQVASLDNITEKEETTEPTRRRSLFNTGFALGYIYPTRQSYAYLTDTTKAENGCSIPSLCEERQLRSRIIRLAYLNSWEFRENFMMGFDLTWGMPNVVGGDITMQYLFTRTDFSPFVGGGLGMQYVVPLDDTLFAYKENAGPAVNAQAGMLFFRTYDIHLMARAQYQWIFNDDKDQGMIYDVGVVYRPDRKGGSGWGTFWKFYLVGVLILATVGSVGSD